MKYIEKKRKSNRGLNMILNESDLRRLVRRMLAEGVVHEKIKRACDSLGNARVSIEEGSDRIIVRYEGLRERPESRKENVDPARINAVYFEKVGVQPENGLVPQTPSGKVLWSVKTSDALKGFGPLLYEVGIEHISLLGGAVMADRRDVSEEALSVWEVYDGRSDIDIEQMDFVVDVEEDDVLDYDDNWADLGYDADDIEGVRVEKVTPEDVSDDVSLDSIFTDRRGGRESWSERVANWKSSPLSHAFSKSDASTIEYLREIEKISFV